MIFEELRKEGIPFAVLTATYDLRNQNPYEWFLICPYNEKALDFEFHKSEHSRSILERELSYEEKEYFLDRLEEFGMKKVHETNHGRVYEVEGEPVKHFYDKRRKYAY